MNSLSFYELQNFASFLETELEGAQLQDLWTNGQLVVFQFYKFKDLFLVLDTDPQKPLLVYLEEIPKIEKKQKPLVLFINSHGKNLRLASAHVEEQKGRVLEIQLIGGTRSCHLQFQLIPKSFNLLVEAGGKKIAWDKPRDLPPSQLPELKEFLQIDWREKGQQWLQEKFQMKGAQETATGPEKKDKKDSRHKALEKKRKALVAIEEQLKENRSENWQKLGEALKISPQVPAELEALYNAKKNRSWNMENAFSQAKLLEKKKAGTAERLEKIKAEIAHLEKDILENPEPQIREAKASNASKLLSKTQSKGRKIQFEEGFEAVMGKSAADNLAILRKAQAWDLWLHLKDYPGSHAIIIRPRNKDVPQSIIQKVSEWLIRESLGHQKIQWGLKYDVVVVECRYVRPIKGDQLGRVTYHHPQVYSFASKA